MCAAWEGRDRSERVGVVVVVACLSLLMEEPCSRNGCAAAVGLTGIQSRIAV